MLITVVIMQYAGRSAWRAAVVGVELCCCGIVAGVLLLCVDILGSLFWMNGTARAFGGSRRAKRMLFMYAILYMQLKKHC